MSVYYVGSLLEVRIMDELVSVWFYRVILNTNNRIESVQIGGKSGDKPTDIGHFAYRNGKLKRIDSYCDYERVLYKAMLKCAKEVFKKYKTKSP